MRFRLKVKWGFLLKWIWIGTALSILQFGLGACLYEPSCSYAQNELLPLMLMLSFPGGIVTFLILAPFLGVTSQVDYALAGLFILCGGYLQWFVVVPRLFGKKHFTVLNLSSPNPNASAVKPFLVSGFRSAKERPEPRRTRHNPFRAFDKQGKTPLERAIRTNPRSPSIPIDACGKMSQSSRHRSPSRASQPSCNVRKEAKLRLEADDNRLPPQLLDGRVPREM
jgi:hypothetical protein